VVLMDNLSAHKRVATLRLLESAGVRVRFLPRYSPEYNPIEGAWSKVKGLLRRWGARTEGALDAAISRAFAAIKAQDAHGWFAHAGYTPTSD
jgi:transposase